MDVFMMLNSLIICLLHHVASISQTLFWIPQYMNGAWGHVPSPVVFPHGLAVGNKRPQCVFCWKAPSVTKNALILAWFSIFTYTAHETNVHSFL